MHSNLYYLANPAAHADRYIHNYIIRCRHLKDCYTSKPFVAVQNTNSQNYVG